MRSFRLPRAGALALAILLVAVALLPACAPSSRVPALDPAEIRRPRSPRPHPHATWVEGHPSYHEGRYVWVRGHWSRQ